MLLGDGVGTIAYVLNTDYSGATFHDAVTRTRYAADVDLATNVLQVVVQLTLTRWLLVRAGAAPVMAIWALAGALVFSLVALATNPHAVAFAGFPLVALASILNRGLSFGMLGPARESLFTRMPRSLRFKGKNAVDTAVWRFGDILVVSGMNLLRQQVGMLAGGFAAIAAVSAGLAGVIGWRLARRVEARGAAAEAGRASIGPASG
jgi:AAA family ATP:ADP antiporter